MAVHIYYLNLSKMIITKLFKETNPEKNPELKELFTKVLFVDKQRLVDGFTKYVFAETKEEKAQYIADREEYIEQFYLDKFAIC